MKARIWRSLPLAGHVLATLLISSLTGPGPVHGKVVSIRDELDFKALRECARDCFVFNGSIDLYGELGCGYPYQNECFCRADLGPAATKHINSCAGTYCTVGGPEGDISAVISIYNSYCLGNGFAVTAVPAEGAAAATAEGSSPTEGAGSDPTGGSSQPQETGGPSAKDQSGDSSSSGLSTGAKIGILVSVISVIISLIGLAVKIYYNRKRSGRASVMGHGSMADSASSSDPKLFVINNNNNNYHHSR